MAAGSQPLRQRIVRVGVGTKTKRLAEVCRGLVDASLAAEQETDLAVQQGGVLRLMELRFLLRFVGLVSN